METNSRAEILQGTLDLLVLHVLSHEKLHGYAISGRIAEQSEEVLRVEEGSLYPCLYRMERRGWITSEVGVSENNRRARYYSLTRRGREQLIRQQKSWDLFTDAVDKVLSGTEK
jgi:PadR family transcriptional regulator PadR